MLTASKCLLAHNWDSVFTLSALCSPLVLHAHPWFSVLTLGAPCYFFFCSGTPSQILRAHPSQVLRAHLPANHSHPPLSRTPHPARNPRPVYYILTLSTPAPIPSELVIVRSAAIVAGTTAFTPVWIALAAPFQAVRLVFETEQQTFIIKYARVFGTPCSRSLTPPLVLRSHLIQGHRVHLIRGTPCSPHPAYTVLTPFQVLRAHTIPGTPCSLHSGYSVLTPLYHSTCFLLTHPRYSVLTHPRYSALTHPMYSALTPFVLWPHPHPK